MGGVVDEQEAAWKQLAAEIGGELITRRERGRRILGRHLQLAVAAKAGTFPIALDLRVEYGGEYAPNTLVTRMRAPYVARDAFLFSIKHLRARLSDGAVLHGMARLAGRHKIEAADIGFERDFLITANDTAQARALFVDSRDVSSARPGWRLFKRSAQRLSVLRFEEEGVIIDIQRLKSLFELFEEMLDRLCQIGSASPEEPTPATLSAYRRDWLE